MSTHTNQQQQHDDDTHNHHEQDVHSRPETSSTTTTNHSFNQQAHHSPTITLKDNDIMDFTNNDDDNSTHLDGTRNSTNMLQTSPVIKILKVNQLDSDRLDFEIENYLLNYIKRVFKHFRVCEYYEPEIMLFIRIFIYKYSIYDNNQTFGDRIQNLKYSNTEMKDPNIFSKYLYGIASIGIPYLYERVCKSQYLNIEYLKRFEYCYKTLEFINFIIFLYQGKYKSLIDRIFHWRKVYATRFMIRQLSFDYMNTELIWNGLAETILFIAPLINFKKLLTFLNRVWDWMTSRMRKDLRMWIENLSQHETLKKDMNSTSLNTIHDTTITGTTSTLQSSSSLTMINNNSSEYYSNQECPFCNANPILIPYVSHDGACKHRFCYYCIENALLNDSSDHCVNCPSCSKEITKSKRFYR